MTQAPTILGPDGSPFPIQELTQGTVRERRRAGESIKKTYKSFVSHLFGLRHDPLFRSEEPFENHAFVYAAAMARAVNLSQAPFMVYREESAVVEDRRARAKAADRKFTLGTGRRRRAVQRHLTRAANPNRFAGLPSKKLIADHDHPLIDVFNRPNPVMMGHQLWMATELWMSLRGECFWLLLDEEGQRVPSRVKGDLPGEIYPLSPELFEAIVQNGRLVGWKYAIKGDKSVGGSGASRNEYAILNPDEVIQFKYFNPNDLFRGVAPITPAAGAINLDLLAQAHNRGILENGADPGGILVDKGATEPWSSDEELEFLERWEQRHKGANNANELAILTGGLEYVPTGLSPKDMEYQESLKYNREQIFAAQRVPKTIVGITENINYSTQLGQDANFWDKTILPEIRYFEDVVDGTLMYQQQDNLVGAFDLAGVEALRAGLSDKVDVVKKLCDFQIHMPPDRAFKFVGIEPPDYELSEVAMANPMLARVDVIATSPNPMGAKTETGADPVQESADHPLLDSIQKEIESKESAASTGSKDTQKAKGAYWRRYVSKLQGPLERKISPKWRSYVYEVKALQMSRFDEAMETRMGSRVDAILRGDNEPIDEDLIDEIILSIESLRGSLGSSLAPLWTEALVDTFAFTIKEDFGGYAVLSVDDALFTEYTIGHQAVVLGGVPMDIQRDLRHSARIAIANGETVQQMRRRFEDVFRVRASASRTLRVARTESSTYINGLREKIFDAQGVEKRKWTTALDEKVRPDHRRLGRSGPRAVGYNYMEFLGKSGAMLHPHDPQAPASQVVNCRCVLTPVIEV